ncbi:hypothetical protein Ddc_13238 [Ditylenchus destructor]|nr:hypothetical protein Ddc_13238 [Ditylenchus destructor]
MGRMPQTGITVSPITKLTSDSEPAGSKTPEGESSQRKVIVTQSRPNRRGNFQKSASIPSEKSYLERKAKKSTEKKSLATTSTLSLGTSPDDMKLIKKLENSFEIAAKKFDLRSVKSIHAKKGRKAPLAEFESSKVAENSPAVELPPVDFLRQLNSSPGQQRRRYFASLTTSGVESKSVESPVKPTAPSRLAELLASPPPPPPQHRQRQPVLVLDGIEAEPLARLSLDGVNATSATLKAQDRLDSHRSGLIDDEIIDQPMLISTSDIALIDDITTTLSVCSAASEEKKAESTKVIASLPTCLLRYCLEDEDDRASSATNDSFLQSVGVNTAAKSHISQIPRRKSKLPTPSPSLSSVAEMDKEVGITALNQTTQVKKSAVGGRMSMPEQKISKMRITER